MKDSRLIELENRLSANFEEICNSIRSTSVGDAEALAKDLIEKYEEALVLGPEARRANAAAVNGRPNEAIALWRRQDMRLNSDRIGRLLAEHHEIQEQILDLC